MPPIRRGNAAIRNKEDLDKVAQRISRASLLSINLVSLDNIKAWKQFGSLGKNALYVEKWCPYVKELAVS